MFLKTERLTLKDYTADDSGNYFRLKSCEPVWQYSTCTPLTEEQSGEALEKLIGIFNQGLPVFSKLLLTETGEYIGEAGIVARNSEAGRCVVGYNLLPEFWGKGYATEITRSLVRYAFETLRVERVEALAQKENAASCRVLEKSGLLLEGVLRHYAKIRGEYADICLYGMIAGDFFGASQTGMDGGTEGWNIRRIGFGTAEYKAELMLRDKILRRPLGLDLFDEDLSRETDDVHLGLFEEERLVGVLVLTKVDSESVRMRQVAVAGDRQHSGVGTALVAAAEREAAALGYRRITLNSRQTATGFYERLGYAAAGEPFSEVGIPHRTMSKTLGK